MRKRRNIHVKGVRTISRYENLNRFYEIVMNLLALRLRTAPIHKHDFGV